MLTVQLYYPHSPRSHFSGIKNLDSYQLSTNGDYDLILVWTEFNHQDTYHKLPNCKNISDLIQVLSDNGNISIHKGLQTENGNSYQLHLSSRNLRDLDYVAQEIEKYLIHLYLTNHTN